MTLPRSRPVGCLNGAQFVAYVYPGWHADAFRPGVDEWALLDEFQPYFAGHLPPPLPLEGRYDDAKPDTAARQIELASEAGISGFLYFVYYDGSDFVLSKPFESGIAAAAKAEESFSLASTWCIRLPHSDFPVPTRDHQVSEYMPTNREASAETGQVDLSCVTVDSVEALCSALAVRSDDLPVIAAAATRRRTLDENGGSGRRGTPHANGVNPEIPMARVVTLGRLKDTLAELGRAVTDVKGQPVSAFGVLDILRRAGIERLPTGQIEELLRRLSNCPAGSDFTIKELEAIIEQSA